MTNERFYNGGPGVGSITYTTPEEIAAWLYEHDNVEGYIQSTYDLATGLADLGDLKGMRENLNFLVDMLSALAKLTGEKVLE
jgi:hypothetical protein